MRVKDLDKLGEQLAKGTFERARTNFAEIKDEIFEKVDPKELIDMVRELREFHDCFEKVFLGDEVADSDSQLTEALLAFGLYLSIILKSYSETIKLLMDLPEAEMELI